VDLPKPDPGNVALRRGVRAAVALPLGLAFSLYGLDYTTGSLFTVFGIVGLLVNADFAGSARNRLESYLLTGVAGTISLTLGWAASFNTVAAVLVTAVVAFTLAFVNLLRGTVAVGTPAVLLVFVVAVSIDNTVSSLPSSLVGWWIAVIVSTLTALLILPRNRRADHRAALARTFGAAARATEATWLHPSGTDAADAFAGFATAVGQLDREFGGQPHRTAGLGPRDSALTLLVEHLNAAYLLLFDRQDRPVLASAMPIPARDDLAQAIVAALDDLSAAMTDPNLLPSAAGLDAARVRLTSAVERATLEQSQAGIAPEELSARIGADHELRMAAIVVEQIVEVARMANGGAIEELERLPPLPRLTASAFLRAQLDPHSPWLRNSLRSALGLGIAVLVVNATGVGHGFWVLLGVISILRFDAVGTRRFALQAVAGTVIGVVVATLVLVTIGQHLWVLWLLLPITVFLSAWSAVAISYPVGQGAFSAMVLVGFGILAWPPQLLVGLIRIEDIALGAVVAVVVGLLMWPRGAVGHLRHELAAAIREANAFLTAAIGACTSSGTDGQLEDMREMAIRTAQRAGETYDLALMQRGPAEDLRPWTATTVTTYLLITTGRIVGHFAQTTPAIRSHPELVTAITRARMASDRHWDAVATAIDDDQADGPTASAPPATDYPHLPSVVTLEDARALIISIWIVDWIEHLGRLPSGRKPPGRHARWPA
jgi:uncharacterized membrane protein YccC